MIFSYDYAIQQDAFSTCAPVGGSSPLEAEMRIAEQAT
jgi:hypothetical protein